MFPLPNIKHINNKKISKKDSYLPKIKGLTLTLSKQRFVDERDTSNIDLRTMKLALW